jgi:hypothetical protein
MARPKTVFGSVKLINRSKLRKILTDEQARKILSVLVRDIIDWEIELKPYILGLVQRSTGYEWIATEEGIGQLGLEPDIDAQDVVGNIIKQDKITVTMNNTKAVMHWGDYSILYGPLTIHNLTRGDQLGKDVSWVKWVDEGDINISGYHVGKNVYYGARPAGRAELGYIMGKGGFWKIRPRQFITETIQHSIDRIRYKMKIIINAYWRSVVGGRAARIALTGR